MKTFFKLLPVLAALILQSVARAGTGFDHDCGSPNASADGVIYFGGLYRHATLSSSGNDNTNFDFTSDATEFVGFGMPIPLYTVTGSSGQAFNLLQYFDYAGCYAYNPYTPSGPATEDAALLANHIDDYRDDLIAPGEDSVYSIDESHTTTDYSASLVLTNSSGQENSYGADGNLLDPYTISRNPGTEPAPPCSCTCNCKDMPRWFVTEPYLNLWIKDTPVFYTTSLGEEIDFTLTSKQRDTRPLDSAVPPTGWGHNWFSYVHFVVPSFLSDSNLTAPGHTGIGAVMPGSTGPVTIKSGWGFTNDFSQWQAILYSRKNGENYFANTNLTEAKTGLILVAIGGNSANGFRLLQQDGSVDEYALVSSPTFSFGLAHSRGGVRDLKATPPKAASFGSTSYFDTGTNAFINTPDDPSSPAPVGEQVGYVSCDAVLTKHTDPYGNAIILGYNSGTNFYLQSLTDYDGKATSFKYDSNGMLTNVSMPYGRTASFTYSGTALTSLTDAQGMTSTVASAPFIYHDLTAPVTNVYVTSLTTPYGTTTFDHYEAPPVIVITNPPSFQKFVVVSGGVSTVSLGLHNDHTFSPVWVGLYGGTNRVNRSIQVNHPDGSHELFMYRYDSRGKVPSTCPTSEIPYADSAWQIDDGLDIYGADVYGADMANGINHLLSTRNSFHWNRQQFAALTNTIENLTTNDFQLATMSHWLETDTTEDIYPGTPEQNVSDQLSFVRAPSPDGIHEGVRTWVTHDGQAGWLAGSYDYDWTATILPDGSVHHVENTYDGEKLTSTVETFTRYTDGARDTRTTTYNYTNSVEFSVAPSHYYNRFTGIDTAAGGSFNLYYPSDTEMDRVDAVGTTSYFYNSRHQLTGINHANGLTTTNYFDGSGFLSKTIDLEAHATNTYTFVNGLPATRTTPLGLNLTYFWDRLGRPTGVGYSDGTTVSNLWTKLDVNAHKDRLGHWTYASFDNMDQLATSTDANGGVTDYSFCFCGGLSSVTDPLGNYTTYDRDYDGNVTQETSSDGFTTTYTRNLVGQVTTLANSAGLSLSYRYNNQGLVTNITSSAGTVFTTLYDDGDRPLQVTDANGVSVTNAYDSVGRLTDQYNAYGLAAHNDYTAQGVYQRYDALSHYTYYGYDPAGRLNTVTNANGEITEFAYNPLGQLTQLEDGNGHLTTWTYDNQGRQLTKTDGNNVLIETNGYNANGWLTAHWSPAKGLTRYTNDPNGNLLGITYNTGTPVTAAYDALNRITTLSDAVGTTAFSYANFGAFKSALAQENGPWASDTVTNIYTNRLQQALNLAQPSGSWAQTYGYDGMQRLHTLASSAGTFSYAYNGAGSQINTLTLPGTGNEIDYTYDGAGSVLSTALKHSGIVLDGYTYAYNAVGNRTSVTRGDNTVVNYGYDSIGQLTSAYGLEPDGVTPRGNENFGYGYDPANNLLMRTNNTLIQTFNTDNANQLVNITRNNDLLTVAGSIAVSNAFSINGQGASIYSDLTFAVTNGVSIANGLNVLTALAFTNGITMTNRTVEFLPTTVGIASDANGNLISDGLHSYVYDCADQLTGIVVTNILKAEFSYDGFGRKRIRKEYAWQTNNWVETNEIHYVYDGMLVIQERASNNIPLVTYTRGGDMSGTMQNAGGIGGLLARSDANGNSAFYHADGNGNITMLASNTGVVLAKYLYDPYGNTLGTWGTLANANTYRFSSKEFEPYAELYDYGYRFYQQNLQRWMQRDPNEENGGINLYGFVKNKPVALIDPLGLFGSDPYTLPSQNGSQVNGVPDISYDPSTAKCKNNDSPKEVMMIAGAMMLPPLAATVPRAGSLICRNKTLIFFTYYGYHMIKENWESDGVSTDKPERPEEPIGPDPKTFRPPPNRVPMPPTRGGR